MKIIDILVAERRKCMERSNALEQLAKAESRYSDAFDIDLEASVKHLIETADHYQTRAERMANLAFEIDDAETAFDEEDATVHAAAVLSGADTHVHLSDWLMSKLGMDDDAAHDLATNYFDADNHEPKDTYGPGDR